MAWSEILWQVSGAIGLENWCFVRNVLHSWNINVFMAAFRMITVFVAEISNLVSDEAPSHCGRRYLEPINFRWYEAEETLPVTSEETDQTPMENPLGIKVVVKWACDNPWPSWCIKYRLLCRWQRHALTPTEVLPRVQVSCLRRAWPDRGNDHKSNKLPNEMEKGGIALIGHRLICQQSYWPLWRNTKYSRYFSQQRFSLNNSVSTIYMIESSLRDNYKGV